MHEIIYIIGKYEEYMKILFVDTETTGLSNTDNDVIQIGLVLRVDTKIVDELDVKCQPVNWDKISSFALQVNNTTIDQLKTYPSPKDAWRKVYRFLYQHFHETTYIFGGQNTPFDWGFMKNWWDKHKDANAPTWESFFKINQLDLQSISKSFREHKLINVPNIKLGTILEALNVKPEGKLHNALTDIKCTDAALIEYVHRINKLKQNNPKHPVAVRFDRLLTLI